MMTGAQTVLSPPEVTGFVEEVVGLVSNVTVPCFASDALRSLAINHAENKSRIGEAGGVDAVLAAMRTHGMSTGVLVEKACAALCCFAANHAANKSRIGEAGGVDVVLSTMRAHKTNASVQKQACGALQRMCVNHAANKTRIVEAGGIDLVLLAMHVHETSAGVQETGRAALRNLSHSNPPVDARTTMQR